MSLSHHYRKLQWLKIWQLFEIDKLEAIFFFLIINLVIILVNMSQRYSIAQKCDMLEEYILNSKNTKQTNQRLASTVEHSPGPEDKSQLICEHLSQLQGIRECPFAS